MYQIRIAKYWKVGTNRHGVSNIIQVQGFSGLGLKRMINSKWKYAAGQTIFADK